MSLTRKRYVKEEDEKILKLHSEGKSFGEIALELQREKTSIAGRHKKLLKRLEDKPTMEKPEGTDGIVQ